MKFLADENFPGPTVRALRGAGFDVVWVLENSPGTPDEGVLILAAQENSILLTLDKDFGELVFRRRLPSGAGIVLFRIVSDSPEMFAALALVALQSRDDWAGHFSVIANDRIRMTPFPSIRPARW